MLDLLTLTALLILAAGYTTDQRRSYLCPQCGSKNGDHAKGCSWRT